MRGVNIPSGQNSTHKHVPVHVHEQVHVYEHISKHRHAHVHAPGPKLLLHIAVGQLNMQRSAPAVTMSVCGHVPWRLSLFWLCVEVCCRGTVEGGELWEQQVAVHMRRSKYAFAFSRRSAYTCAWHIVRINACAPAYPECGTSQISFLICFKLFDRIFVIVHVLFGFLPAAVSGCFV